MFYVDPVSAVVAAQRFADLTFYSGWCWFCSRQNQIFPKVEQVELLAKLLQVKTSQKLQHMFLNLCTIKNISVQEEVRALPAPLQPVSG